MTAGKTLEERVTAVEENMREVLNKLDQVSVLCIAALFNAESRDRL